jgi:hypothetical protein
MAVTAGGTANQTHTVYWDMDTKSIKYHSHNGAAITMSNANYTGTAVATVAMKNWINLDGGADRHEWPQNGSPTANQGTNLIVQTQTSGNTVTAIYVTEGQYVKAGTPLYYAGGATKTATVEGTVVDMSIQVGSTVGTTPLYIIPNASYTTGVVSSTAPLYKRIRTGDTSGVYVGATGPFTNTENQADLLRTSVTGMYGSVAVTSAGYPRVVYFDQTNQRPRLAYANLETPTAADFKSLYVLDADNEPNYKFIGKFSAIKVDSQNNLHIAMLRTMGASQLIYVKLTPTGSGATMTYTPGMSTIVDNTGSVGSWIEMYLDSKEKPWISYIDMSRKDFYDGVKMAYLSTQQFPTASTDINGKGNTGWEYLNVPARFIAKEARTGVAVHENTANRFWQAAVGYLSDDYFRVAYYIRPVAASGPTP